MVADSPEHQLPIDAVKETFDIEIEAPSRSANSAHEPCARHRSQTCRVGSRRSRGETPAPQSAPDSVGRLPERCGPQPSERPTVASHHSPLECRPAAPAEESSSLTTADSRVYRGCPKGWPRTPQSTVHPRQPLPGWPSHA